MSEINISEKKTLPYNTGEPTLLMPEYGRNIQKLVDYCVNIEDREERLKCAQSIAGVMMTLFPGIEADKGDSQKIWDHINIMSKFKLDIDFPCNVISEDELQPKVKPIPYSGALYRYRYYGKNLQSMIKRVAEMENCLEKDQIIFLLANQMKKQLVAQTPENVSDARIFEDIAEISNGKILIDSASYRLNEYIDVATPPTGKSKKKKK
ncbi:MAG: DUF4290 domain-containing protein [Muribaculaceae bacterium]|nr:DUF4290 domain-containing protein [Muribaculaceae bacterium]